MAEKITLSRKKEKNINDIRQKTKAIIAMNTPKNRSVTTAFKDYQRQARFC